MESETECFGTASRYTSQPQGKICLDIDATEVYDERMSVKRPARAERAATGQARPYRMRKRQDDVQQTRQRIVDAAVELHGTVGPAQTTVSAIAELAGVQRSTVYRHFEDDDALFGACTSQWFASHPWPSPSGWTTVADPVERLEAGLRQLYRYFDENRQMLANVSRDLLAMPLFVQELMRAHTHATLVVLMEPWAEAGVDQLEPALALAVDFNSWLAVDRAGLTPDEAAATMTRMLVALT
jgi:AcrR family transcriptional regulator